MIHFAVKTRRRTDLEIDFAKTICTFDAKIVLPWNDLTISHVKAKKNHSFLVLSTETEGAASCEAAPLVLNIKKNGKSFGSLE